jgi:murein DD-endopeptidase MepM/ murein hydrolase activator NlpD
MKGLALLFGLFFLRSTLADNGYPLEKADIVFDKKAVIKNKYCFPIVVNVLNQSFDVAENSEMALNSQSWGPWNWIPGIRSGITSKKMFYPLKNKTTVDFGPNVAPTHLGENKYGYDFNTPEKTPVFAMEGGIVIRAISHFYLAHQDMKRLSETNTVEILHPDGTVARYTHFFPNSLRVKVCQKVKAGEEIGLSGNTGFSSVPHLHVDVFRPNSGTTFETIPLHLSVSPP